MMSNWEGDVDAVRSAAIVCGQAARGLKGHAPMHVDLMDLSVAIGELEDAVAEGLSERWIRIVKPILANMQQAESWWRQGQNATAASILDKCEPKLLDVARTLQAQGQTGW
jgi:hypothetical protein